jgi:hypothetical protein
MDTLLISVLNSLLNGGNGAIVAILLFICYGLWIDRNKLMQQNEAAQRRLDEVAERQLRSTEEVVAAIRRGPVPVNLKL